MEEMQGVEDDNHNCRAEAVSVCSPAQVCVDSDSCSDTCESTSALLLNSTAKFHLNVMTAEEYKTVYWPKLEQAIEHLLTQSPMEHISISYEQIYSQVYKCVCQQHSELLYNDLMWKIRSHLEQVSSELQNKFYIETKLNRDLRDDLMKLFSDHVAEKHVGTLLPLLKKAHSMPFQVKPSTMASVVKGLYALRPDWVPLAPALFSRFIPQIHPPALESQLLYYADQDKKLQLELHQNGFSRGDQSRKRASEES
ncbi:CDK2-associated and cullin domain-containing protein 1-like isoform X2 [Cyprinus carpio]|uniref:CDK2-associated and cullin domain-containing protein 1-like isoform X2 n=1 Tax=Cyprinus carpio TaxID=7962 RepID=A0A9Q9X1J3_CYPCA|nr:CDK2-associated and cullin domain-containing protein 1-like isoform X2 [Cyprinus carpio]